MNFFGEVIALCRIPVAARLPGSAAFGWVDLVRRSVVVVAVEDYGGIEIGGIKDYVVEVMSCIGPRNEEEEECRIAKSL